MDFRGMFATRLFLLPCLLLLPAMVCAEDRKPNVILILADDLGAFELAVMGRRKSKRRTSIS